MVHPGELGFVREVKVAFQDDMEKYDQFCKLWLDMKFKRIHESLFIAKLKSLVECHKYLFWEFIRLLPKEHMPLWSEYVSEFLKAVKVSVKDDCGDFIKVMQDYCKRNIDENYLLERVKVLLRGHANLILEFNTLFLPTRRHITIPPWDQLPQDVLDVISQKLDFDDLFRFSSVCTDWRVSYESIDKSKFLTSQEPLLLEFFNYPVKVPYSFTSLPTQKVYPLKKMMMNMLSYSNNSFPIYVTYSSGYFIIIDDNSSFLLINPFTRIKKKVICPSTFKFSSFSQHTYRALLAFDKCSEEDFVLLFLFSASNGFHVYQSRNNGWVTYSTVDDEEAVVDFVALNNIIYVVTDEPKIGVLCLDSPKIKYLPMVNSPDLNATLSFFNLVKCDEQLLLARLNPSLSPAITLGAPPPERKVYKIDFSTMTYVELETLGDIALFYVSFRSCKALINPNKWGYESNSVYEVYNSVRINNPFCTVYNWDTKSEKYIEPPNPRTKGSVFDWCFRHPEI